MSLLPEISQASTEINKLVAQANIHQTIAPVNPAAFTDPADTMLLASRDPVIREVSVGMTGEAYSDYSVSGTPPLSLPNSLGKPLKAWEVDVLPYQEGTGDPSPSNVRPIYGTDKLTITTAGKNLFANDTDEITAVQYYISDPSAVTTRYGYEIYLPAGTYTAHAEFIGTPTSTYIYGGVYKPDGQRVGGSKNIVTDTTLTAQTLTINAGEKLMFFDGTSTSSVPVAQSRFGALNIMIELGSTATSYTPYLTPSQTVLTLPQTVYTGTIGSEGGESRSAKLIADDTRNWRVSASNSTNIVFSVGVLPQGAAIESGQISNMFGLNLTANVPSDSSRKNKFVLGVSGNLFVQVSIAEYPDVDTFKAMLAVTPLHIVYPLANSTTFAVPSATIPTPTGTATTWATAEDGTVESMEVTYYKSE